MGVGNPLHMGGNVPASIPGAASSRVPLEGMVPPQAPFSLVSIPVDEALLPHAPLPAVSGVPHPAPPMAIIRTAEPFERPMMKDANAYLDHYSIIRCYLCCPGFLTQWADNALITDSRNLEASCFWEGQIRIAVQDNSLCFLFENKGSKYDGKGFKMLAELNQHCQSDSIANAFTTLMLLFNHSMTDSKEIMAFCLRFGGMVNNMVRCKITIPPILLVMFYLWALYPCYKDLLKLFCSGYKSLESASLDSIVVDVLYHDKFKLVGSDNKKSPAGHQKWFYAPYRIVEMFFQLI
jgi:hypothetical protein